MAESIEHNVVIGSSNLNIDPRAALRFNAGDYRQFLDRGGYDVEAGFEWSDLRLPAVRQAAYSLAEDGVITALHESWSEDNIISVARAAGTLGVGGTFEALQIAAVFPLLDKSYDKLAGLQSVAGKKLPLIIHPNGQQLGGKLPKRPRQQYDRYEFAEIWYQPTAEWAASLGVPLNSRDIQATTEMIEEAARAQHLGGMALDLHHLVTERDGKKFANANQLAVSLAASPTMRELQVAIRPDFGGDQATLKAACEGKLWQTQIGEILTAIHEVHNALKPLRVVTEVAASEVIRIGFPDYASAHANITHSIRSILG